MNILGLGGAVGHDPATALFVNGELVAAVEEERFIRDKHAKGKAGHEATKFCLKQATAYFFAILRVGVTQSIQGFANHKHSQTKLLNFMK